MTIHDSCILDMSHLVKDKYNNYPSLRNTTTCKPCITTTTSETPGIDRRMQQEQHQHHQQYFEVVDESGHDDEEREESENDFLKRILDTNTCQVPVILCNGVICHASLEDQLDMFMHCRQPLSMFSFFRDHHHHHPDSQEDVVVRVPALTAGAYVLPTFCEYCKASNKAFCPSHCERPKLFFQKKRPPFCKLNPNMWNPQNDFALRQEEITPDDDESTTSDSQQLEEVEADVVAGNDRKIIASNDEGDNDYVRLPEMPSTNGKEVASLVSAWGSTSNISRSSTANHHHGGRLKCLRSTTYPNLNETSESYADNALPRHSWMTLFSATRREQPVVH